MRTKEYRVEIDEESAKRFINGKHQGISVYNDGHTVGNLRPIKAKLIIELPERKVEITEARLQEVLNSITFDSWSEFEKKLKKKLFGEQP